MKALIAIGLFLLGSATALAFYTITEGPPRGGPWLPEMVERSDLIAVVKVEGISMRLKLQARSPRNRLAFLKNLSAAGRKELFQYRNLRLLTDEEASSVLKTASNAERKQFRAAFDSVVRANSTPPIGAAVVTAIKGPKKDLLLTLVPDEIPCCPIPEIVLIDYERGETCLVFAERMENGHYRTFPGSGLKFAVVNGTVKRWRSAVKDGRVVSAKAADVKLEEAIAQILKAAAEPTPRLGSDKAVEPYPVKPPKKK